MQEATHSGPLWRHRQALAVVALGAAFLAGRTSLPKPAPKPTAPPSELVLSLDLLEARLTEARSLVDHNVALRQRHERVSAIACTGAENHSRDSARIVAEHKRRKQRHQDDDLMESATTASVTIPTSLNGRRLAAVPALSRPNTHSP